MNFALKPLSVICRARRKSVLRLVGARGPVGGDPGSRAELKEEASC